MWYAYCDILNSYYYQTAVIESFGRDRSPASDVDRMPSFARHELLHLGNTRTEYPKQASQFTTILSINLYVLHFNHRRLKICENFQNINPNFPFNNMWELFKPTKNMHFMELEKIPPLLPLSVMIAASSSVPSCLDLISVLELLWLRYEGNKSFQMIIQFPQFAGRSLRCNSYWRVR